MLGCLEQDQLAFMQMCTLDCRSHNVHVPRNCKCLLQAVGAAVDAFVAALDTHKWVTLGSVSARARKQSSSGALPEAGGHGGNVCCFQM